MKESVRNEIVRLSAQGVSGRRIAQQLRVSRHTVHAALQQVTKRLPGLRLDPEAVDVHIDGLGARSPNHLPVVWDA